MARIEYCDDETLKDWHPAYAGDYCAEPRRKDAWVEGSYYYQVTVNDCVVSLADQYFDPLLKDHREQQFQQLANRWKRETAFNGHLSKIVMHDDYQRIMAMGPDVIPFILRDLAKKPAHWFWALHNLVPDGQDPAEGLTTIEEARQAWLKWGRDNNYL
jgi:hypothetical protein